VRLVRPDGEVRVISDQAEFELDASGKVVAMTGACLDVTERKRGIVLERDRGLILEQVVQSDTVEAIMQRLAEALEHQRPGLRACLLVLRQGRWCVGAAPSLRGGFTAEVEALPIGELAASFAAAAFAHAPVLVGDVGSASGWSEAKPICDRHQIASCWSAPILAAQGGVLGTMCLLGRSPREASAEDRELLESISRLAAVAIEHRTLTDELSYQAHHDSLTGLPNRALFQDRLAQAIALARRDRSQVAVIYMDMDRFKQVNDSMGHAAGDELLRQAAARLQGCIRSSDTLARLGGDEFTVVLTQLTLPGDAMRVARAMMEAVRAPFVVGNRELFVSLSLGISAYPDDGADAATMMVNADVAMYRAKELGRDNFQWFDAEMNEVAREKMELEGQLRRALEMGELRLEYQPQCDREDQVVAFEALMRWHHPTLGEVSPGRFIPLAEDTGLIVPMGEWALRTACAQAAAWRAAGHEHIRVSVNVSAVQFRRPDWVDTVRHALREAGLPPQALELEITESLLLQNAKESTANLFELRAMDVGVAIDDFGTGYSSLSYLHKLPISTLKIDQSFVREIGLAPVSGQEDAPIIRTIIALAHNLGMTVVAEGVETSVQRRVLLELGCECLQGYLLHRPLSVEAATRLLAAGP
jgi:diguanylate cyclase (GGDEF)-like protein